MHAFTVRDILWRALATFGQAFTTTLLASGVSEDIGDLAIWEKALFSGLVALVTLVHRLSQSYLVSLQSPE